MNELKTTIEALRGKLKTKERKKPETTFRQPRKGLKISNSLKFLLIKEAEIGGRIRRAVIKTIPVIFMPKIVAVPKIK